MIGLIIEPIIGWRAVMTSLHYRHAATLQIGGLPDRSRRVVLRLGDSAGHLDIYHWYLHTVSHAAYMHNSDELYDIMQTSATNVCS